MAKAAAIVAAASKQVSVFFIVVPRGGTYTFSTVSDDGSWLYVRGTMVVENLARAVRRADGSATPCADGARLSRVRLQLISVVLVNYALTTDSRYAVTRWMQEHVGRDEVVAARGPLEYFMIADGFTSVSVESVEDVAGAKPAFIVLNADQIASLPPGHAVRTMHDALLDGRAGYRLALRYRTRPLPWPGRHPDLGDTPRRPAFSSLSKVNPTLEVFERDRS